jgi:hypothetical protein
VANLQVEMGDSLGAGRTLLRLADLHGTRYGNVSAQDDAMKRALFEFTASGDEAGVSSVARGLALVKLGQGHAGAARVGYESALLASGADARAPDLSGQRLARHGTFQAMMLEGHVLSALEGLLQLVQVCMVRACVSINTHTLTIFVRVCVYMYMLIHNICMDMCTHTHTHTHRRRKMRHSAPPACSIWVPYISTVGDYLLHRTFWVAHRRPIPPCATPTNTQRQVSY